MRRITSNKSQKHLQSVVLRISFASGLPKAFSSSVWSLFSRSNERIAITPSVTRLNNCLLQYFSTLMTFNIEQKERPSILLLILRNHCKTTLAVEAENVFYIVLLHHQDKLSIINLYHRWLKHVPLPRFTACNGIDPYAGLIKEAEL